MNLNGAVIAGGTVGIPGGSIGAAAGAGLAGGIGIAAACRLEKGSRMEPSICDGWPFRVSSLTRAGAAKRAIACDGRSRAAGVTDGTS